jgi:transcriptional regulator with XRE-family HTH domain
MTAESPNKIHQGRNVKRFREMLGLKQEALALELGDDWTQKRISLLESKEIIEPEVLSEVAKALKVPEEAIKNFDEEKAIYNIQNNYEGSNSGATNVGPANYMNYQCTFNPIDKVVELFEENKRLYVEKIELLERLLQAEKDKR